MASDALVREWTAAAVRDIEAQGARKPTPAIVCDAVLVAAQAAGWSIGQLPQRHTLIGRLKKSLSRAAKGDHN